jgi:hypothetical protein
MAELPEVKEGKGRKNSGSRNRRQKQEESLKHALHARQRVSNKECDSL